MTTGSHAFDRREFLQSIATGAAVGGLTGGGWLTNGLTGSAMGAPVRFQLDAQMVMYMVQETPRERVIEATVEMIRRGVTYKEFVRALFLEGIREINPHPPGFKLHAVLSMTAVQQISQEVPDSLRWFPVIWSFDNLKGAMEQDVKEGNFVLSEFDGEIPAPAKAIAEFHAGMESWDQAKAEGALISLIRSCGANEVIELLWLYGARDYRNIGHKAIVVSNAWQTLQAIGWEHAEPVLRSSLSSLLDFGPTEEKNGFAYENQCYLSNKQIAEAELAQLPDNWAVGTFFSSDATRKLVESMRTKSLDEVRTEILTLLKSGEIRADSVWDAVHLAAGEMMLRAPGIYPLHAVTSSHALHYAYRNSAVPLTRLILLLQGAGWVLQFRDFIETQPNLPAKVDIFDLKRGPIPQEADLAAKDIFHALPKSIPEATAMAYSYGQQFYTDEAFRRLARELVAKKGSDPHDYKFAAAMFELIDWTHMDWKPHLLAVAVQHLPGVRTPDPELMVKAKTALKEIA